jgi:prepilin peptidase CpaA
MDSLQQQLMFTGISLLCASIGSFHDLRERRIPNYVTAPSMAAGCVLHMAFGGGRGLEDSVLAGFIAGGIFLLFFLAGGMGAGDVKLMTAVGCIAGLSPLRMIVIATAIAGGLFSLAVSSYHGRLRETLRGVVVLIRHHGSHGFRASPGTQPIQQQHDSPAVCVADRSRMPVRRSRLGAGGTPVNPRRILVAPRSRRAGVRSLHLGSLQKANCSCAADRLHCEVRCSVARSSGRRATQARQHGVGRMAHNHPHRRCISRSLRTQRPCGSLSTLQRSADPRSRSRCSRLGHRSRQQDSGRHARRSLALRRSCRRGRISHPWLPPRRPRHLPLGQFARAAHRNGSAECYRPCGRPPDRA